MSTEIVQTTTATEQTMNIGEFMIAKKRVPGTIILPEKMVKQKKVKKRSG